MKAPIFYAKVTDEEKPRLIFEKRNEFDLWVGSLAGDDIKVEVKVSKMTRSDRQRKYYFAEIVGKLINPLGVNGKDEANEWLKDHFNNRVIMVRGKEVEIGMSIEREKTNRVEEIYKNIREWASRDLKTFIREPNEEELYGR